MNAAHTNQIEVKLKRIEKNCTPNTTKRPRTTTTTTTIFTIRMYFDRHAYQLLTNIVNIQQQHQNIQPDMKCQSMHTAATEVPNR